MKFFGIRFILPLVAVFFLFKGLGLQAAQPIPDLTAKGSWRADEAYFDSEKTVVKSLAFDFLDRIVDILKSNPELFVNIYGHTDNIGTKSYNEALSLSRANSVKTYLMDKGIDGARLYCKGFGSSNPAAPNKTAKGRALNRRAELFPFIK
jgi:OmpA-OmpF porin, OOP family